MKRKVLGFLLILIGVLAFSACDFSPVTADNLGEITFELYDQDNNLVATKTAAYQEGETLLGLLQSQFTVYCADEDGNPSTTCESIAAFYGVYIMGIDDVQAFEGQCYIAFYINGEYASTGIDSTPIVDGNVYQFKYETY